jgi:hypothetical protein
MKWIRVAGLILAGAGGLVWLGLPPAAGLILAAAPPHAAAQTPEHGGPTPAADAPETAAPTQGQAPAQGQAAAQGQAVAQSAAALPPASGQAAAAQPSAPGQGAGAAPAQPPAELWIVPGARDAGGTGALGGAAGRTGSAGGGALALVAAAQQQAAAVESAARGEVPQGGSGRQDTVWGALGAVEAGLDDLAGLLAAHDTRYLPALEETVRQGMALAVAWRRTSSTGAAAAPRTGRRIAVLTGSLARLRDGYGRAAVRARSAAPPSVAELAQQRQLAQAARQWQAQLPAVAAAARRQGDGPLLLVVSQVGAQLQLIMASPATLAGLLGALRSSENAVGLWTANAAFVSPSEQQAWLEADTGATDLSTAEETGFVLTADLTSGATARYVEGGGGTGGDGGAGAGAGDPGGGYEAGDAAGAGTGDPAAGAMEAGGRETEGLESGGFEADREGGAPAGGGGAAGSAAGGEMAAAAPSDLGAGHFADGAAAAGQPEPGSLAPPETAALASPETAAAAEPGAGWMVIHGNPESGVSAADGENPSPAATGDMFALLLGDTSAGESGIALDETETPSEPGDDDAAPSAALIGSDQACRPWRPPAAPVDICPLALSPLKP